MADLLHMYQTLNHDYVELARSNEDECFTLLNVIRVLQQKCKKTEDGVIDLTRIIATCENDLAESRRERKKVGAELLEARSQIAGMVAARQYLEKENAVLERQIEVVRDLLRDEANNLPEHKRQDLQFLNNYVPRPRLPQHSVSVLTEHDIDYDKSEDSMDEHADVGELAFAGGDNAGCRSRSINLLRDAVAAEPDIQVESHPEETEGHPNTHAVGGGRLFGSTLGALLSKGGIGRKEKKFFNNPWK